MSTNLTPEIKISPGIKPCYALNFYTDGAYFKNNCSGGWGYIAFCNEQERYRDCGYKKTNSSLEMELLAAIKAIKSIPQVTGHLENCPVTIHTDSKIIIEGLFEKFCDWERNHWKVKSGKTVVFKELWQELYKLTKNYDVQWRWIKAHSGTLGNELADQLARQAALKNMPI